MSEFIPPEAFQFYQQAELLFSQGNIEAAISLYQRSIELNSKFSWSYHQLGEAFFQLEKWEEAISAYHHAIKLNPKFSWSYYNLGNALSEMNQFNKIEQNRSLRNKLYILSYTRLFYNIKVFLIELDV
jgi:tetratricopeptide (TPR) repeat protein